MIVEQLENKNQFKIFCKNGVAFQSYSSLIAYKEGWDTVFLSDKWDYSKTTLKHLKIFLRIDLSKREIEDKIAKGEYRVVSEDELQQLVFNGLSRVA